MTYTAAVRAPEFSEAPPQPTMQQPNEHPTQELPTLNLPQAELPQPQPQEQPQPKSLASRVASQVVTVILAIAVLGVLFVNVGPLVLPYKVYTVLSGSMTPTIPIGSEVVLTPVAASQIQVGDIITFKNPRNTSELVTHRVVGTQRDSAGNLYWTTKGDANGAPDTWRIPAQGTGLRYAFHVPFIGYAFAMLGSPLGRIMFILAPALLLAAVVLNDLWKTPAQKKPAA